LTQEKVSPPASKPSRVDDWKLFRIPSKRAKRATSVPNSKKKPMLNLEEPAWDDAVRSLVQTPSFQAEEVREERLGD
jgi:hypothetical protein